MKKLAIRNKYLSIFLAMVLALLAVVPVNILQPVIAKAADTKRGVAVNPETATVSWDCVYFGHYAPNNGTAEPIKWRILSEDGNGDAFLMADQNLDVKPYMNNGYTQNVSWEQSYLRKWLNGIGADWEETSKNNFLKAFEEEELAAIQADGQDKISILSFQDINKAEYGFVSGYSLAQSARASDNTDAVKTAYQDASSAWWLKGTADGFDTLCVEADGSIDRRKTSDATVAVRPVLHLNLNSNVCKDAGSVTVELGEKLNQTRPENPAVNQEEGTVSWDTVYFGHYYQNNSTDKEAIKWRVLSVQGDEALLLADQSLDVRTFNDSVSQNLNWNDSTLRKWLNGAKNSWESYYSSNFLKDAFSIEEKLGIKADANNDQVTLLSSEDVDNPAYGFFSRTDYKSGLKTKATEGTTYARREHDINTWWLQDGELSDIYYVDGGGSVAQQTMNTYNGVRPVVRLDLNSGVWSRADSVTVEMGERVSGDSGTLTGPDIVPGTGNSSAVAAWDRIYFGSYWQEDTNGDGKADENDDKTPIKWRILSLNGNDAFLMADQILDYQRCKDFYGNYSWDSGENGVRKWLGTSFYNTAFTKKERSAIMEQTVVTEPNEVYGEGENAVTSMNEKVYLLSIEEVSGALGESYGFRQEFNLKCPTRVATNTAYAMGRNNLTNKDKDAGDWWLLRSKGADGRIACVWGSGHGEYRGIDANWECGIRPVLHLDLSKNVWMNEPEDEKMKPVEMEEEEMPDSLPTKKPGETAGPDSSPQPTEDPVNHGLHNPVIVDDVTTWDCIYFGNYYQESEKQKEPIKWRVLSVHGDDAFLMADKNLDSRSYNNKWEAVTWMKSDLRTWLNDKFLKTAFSATEQAAIKTTVAKSSGDKITVNDKVYLLSINEAKNELYGFSSNAKKESNSRVALNTSHVSQSNSAMFPLNNADWYWLRSSGDNAYRAAHVGNEGNIYEDGSSVNDSYYAVRPVLHLDLSHSVWKKTDSTDSSLSDMVKTTASTVKKQTKVTDSAGNAYTVTQSAAKKGQVSYTAPKSQSVTSVVIPSTVTIKGVRYQVTSVKTGALKNCKKLKKLTVGKNVRKIGAKACYGCTNLKKVTLKTTKLSSKTIGKQSFAKMNNQAKIVVPKKKSKAYQTILRKRGVTGKKQKIK